LAGNASPSFQTEKGFHQARGQRQGPKKQGWVNHQHSSLARAQIASTFRELNLKVSIVRCDCRLLLTVNQLPLRAGGKGNPVAKAIEKPRPSGITNLLSICNPLYLIPFFAFLHFTPYTKYMF
jgi:hypothetical protein